eukprot:Nitzschia sp. Nitz4//scaffold99_size76975//75210//76392//NITZ4_005589-RA/size76975-processed-gene-0.40-mRNA-1//1//CDS//3329560889//3843//frame0
MESSHLFCQSGILEESSTYRFRTGRGGGKPNRNNSSESPSFWKKKKSSPISEQGSPLRDFRSIWEGTSVSGRPPFQDASLFAWLGQALQGVLACGRLVVPPTLGLLSKIVTFYQGLTKDAILAQVGLVYCFAGGYYPTLFSSVHAARHCGWDIMVSALCDLLQEAKKVIQATNSMQWDDIERRDIFLRQVKTVLRTMDPLKINQAVGALYTTWIGVSAVLEQEYARVIAMSLTIADYLEKIARWVLEPPILAMVDPSYHQWIPVLIGWITKAVAMNVAWRMQRVLTASTSAIAGGLMFSRAALRILHKRGIHVFGLVDASGEASALDEVIGLTVAALGFWTQIEVQYKNNFSFVVPFPFNLVTWPFDILERWIQWSITTKHARRYPRFALWK